MRFRPYADGTVTRVAAVWNRDGRLWRLGSGQTPDEIRRQDEKNRTEKFLPVDVAGYVTSVGGQPAERYAALWVEKSGDDDARLYLGATDDDLTGVQKPLDDAKLIPRTLHALRSPDGRVRYSGVWGKPPSAGVSTQGYRDLFAWDFAENQALFSDRVLVDVAVGEAGKRLSVAERARAALKRAEKTLQTKPDDLSALDARARALLRLGENDKALGRPQRRACQEQGRLERARTAGDRAGAARQEGTRPRRPGTVSEGRAGRIRALPGRRRRGGARRRGRRRDPGPGGCAQEGTRRRRPALRRRRAFALASKAVNKNDHEKARALAARSLALLEQGVRDNDLSFALLDDSPDLDPLRDDPAFARLLEAGHPERRFAGVWSTEALFEAASLDALDPAEHLRRGRELAAQGYRPVAWSVARTSPEGPPLSASVWHRPLVPSETKDRLAERQARAAVALVRLG